MGTTGIFAIETKNFRGSYTIDGNQWLYGSGSNTIEAYSNPGEQIKVNTRVMLKFLSSEGLNMFKRSTFPVVAFINPNLTIRNKPKHYDVMHPSNLQNFILSRKSKLSDEYVMAAARALKLYCAEISYYGNYSKF